MANEETDHLKRESALLLGAQAPVIYCSGILGPGIEGGVGKVTLTVGLNAAMLSGEIVAGVAPVAHLRFSLAVVPLLRQALDEIDLLAKPSASNEKQ